MMLNLFDSSAYSPVNCNFSIEYFSIHQLFCIVLICPYCSRLQRHAFPFGIEPKLQFNYSTQKNHCAMLDWARNQQLMCDFRHRIQSNYSITGVCTDGQRSTCARSSSKFIYATTLSYSDDKQTNSRRASRLSTSIPPSFRGHANFDHGDICDICHGGMGFESTSGVAFASSFMNLCNGLLYHIMCSRLFFVNNLAVLTHA